MHAARNPPALLFTLRFRLPPNFARGPSSTSSTTCTCFQRPCPNHPSRFITCQRCDKLPGDDDSAVQAGCRPPVSRAQGRRPVHKARASTYRYKFLSNLSQWQQLLTRPRNTCISRSSSRRSYRAVRSMLSFSRLSRFSKQRRAMSLPAFPSPKTT